MWTHEEVYSTCRHRFFFKEPFFHNRPKNGAQDLKKNGLERRVPRFCTICDKSQPLNKNWESYGNFSAQMGLKS